MTKQPVLQFRLRSPDTSSDEQWQQTFQMIVENPGCCDEVWFSTGIAVPPLEWHRANAERIARGAEQLRNKGIASGLQIQATIGHSDSLSALECMDGKTWGGWTGRGGLECVNCNCPRQPAFLDYIRKMSEYYAAIHPSSVWIDDDLRIAAHSPASPRAKEKEGWIGCWCDTCIAAFNAETKASWTRETLDQAMAPDSALFHQWKAFSERSVLAIAKTIAEVFTKVSPESLLALQNGYCVCDTFTLVLKALHEVSGRPVGSRPGGGAYYDTDPNSQIIKSLREARFRKDMGDPQWISVWTPEIESYPRNYGSRSAQSILVEAFSALMTGMTACSMLVTHTGHEPAELYSRTILKPIADAAPVLKGYAASCEGTLPAGFSSSLPVDPLYAFAHTGVPVLFGIGKSYGELREEEVQRDHCLATSSEVQKWREELDARAGGTVAVLESPFVGLMLPRVTEDGNLKTVALLNLRIDSQGPIVLRLRGLPAGTRQAVWHELRRKPLPLPIRFETERAYVTIPEIGVWNGGYLDFTTQA
ncbi:MAG: hypothetical protein IJJ26_06975 [Victivallales bacterium]|nr:hypothetical protein [Victivallales bacterium]